jgi:hypothetical protein
MHQGGPGAHVAEGGSRLRPRHAHPSHPRDGPRRGPLGSWVAWGRWQDAGSELGGPAQAGAAGPGQRAPPSRGSAGPRWQDGGAILPRSRGQPTRRAGSGLERRARRRCQRAAVVRSGSANPGAALRPPATPLGTRRPCTWRVRVGLGCGAVMVTGSGRLARCFRLSSGGRPRRRGRGRLRQRAGICGMPMRRRSQHTTSDAQPKRTRAIRHSGCPLVPAHARQRKRRRAGIIMTKWYGMGEPTVVPTHR